MISEFGSDATEDIYFGRDTKAARKLLPQELHRKARLQLVWLNAQTDFEKLRFPPSNVFEALIGKRKGEYSVRINRQYRICFTWIDNNAGSVTIEDYH